MKEPQLKLRVSPAANNHLKGIIEHIALDNVDRAYKLVEDLEERFALLCQFPDMGTSGRKNYRYFPYGNYVIVYSHDEKSLTIQGVRHAKLDVLSRK